MKRRADYIEMQKKMVDLEKGMNPGDKEYSALMKRMEEVGNDHKKITKTTYWHWLTERNDFPEMFFYSTPPIGEAPESARILVTGTKVETSDMYAILKGMEAYQRVMKSLEANQAQTFSGSNLVQVITGNQKSKTELEEIKPDYVFSSGVGGFWQNFFGEDSFLDEPKIISIPCLIVGTGYMRNYNRFGGETINVRERLKTLADEWDIPIQFINFWAP